MDAKAAPQGVIIASDFARRFDIGVEIGFQTVMRGHLVALATFLVQPHPPALAFRKIILAHA